MCIIYIYIYVTPLPPFNHFRLVFAHGTRPKLCSQWCSPQNCQMFMNFAHGGSRMQMSFKEMVVTIDIGPKVPNFIYEDDP